MGNNITCNECQNNNIKPEFFTKEIVNDLETETLAIVNGNYYNIFGRKYHKYYITNKYCYVCSNNHKQSVQTEKSISYKYF